MKAVLRLISLAAVALAMSAVSFAANKNEGSFTLSDTARIGSTELQPGDYKAQWTPESANTVKVEILRHGKPVATVDGKLKNLEAPPAHGAIITKTGGENANSIGEIDFSNRKEALVFGE